MPSPEILPFADEHLAAAGDLLAARHRAHRAAEPLLSPRYEDPEAARAEVAAAFAAEDASGSVAVSGDRVVGYLLGAPKGGSAWGPNAWVEAAGHAVEEAETARALYAVAATRWVEEGRTAHYALLPAYDTALIGAWFRLAFGHQHTHAIREPAAAGPVREGLVVRQPERVGDSGARPPRHGAPRPPGARADLLLGSSRRLRGAGGGLGGGLRQPEVLERRRRARGRDRRLRRGMLAGSVVHATRARLVRTALRSSGFAAVFPEARGLGVGRAVGEAVSAWALSEGYPSIVTDWRETNLLSSRAWRGLGYRDTFTRVHRLVGSLRPTRRAQVRGGGFLKAMAMTVPAIIVRINRMDAEARAAAPSSSPAASSGAASIRTKAAMIVTTRRPLSRKSRMRAGSPAGRLSPAQRAGPRRRSQRCRNGTDHQQVGDRRRCAARWLRVLLPGVTGIGQQDRCGLRGRQGSPNGAGAGVGGRPCPARRRWPRPLLRGGRGRRANEGRRARRVEGARGGRCSRGSSFRAGHRGALDERREGPHLRRWRGRSRSRAARSRRARRCGVRRNPAGRRASCRRSSPARRRTPRSRGRMYSSKSAPAGIPSMSMKTRASGSRFLRPSYRPLACGWQSVRR